MTTSNKRQHMKTETTARRSRQILCLAVALPALLAMGTGCTSMGMPEGSPAMKQQALSFTPPPGKAGVYVIHPYQISFGVGGLVGNTMMRESSQVNLDYQEFGQVDFNTYLFGLVPPGDHVLSSGDIVSSTKVVHFTAEAGKNYFFMVGADGIDSTSETNGQSCVRRFKLSGDNRFEYQNAPGQTQ
jgi:hypothetical protein